MSIQEIISLSFKVIRKILNYFIKRLEWINCSILFYIHNVKVKGFRTSGYPYIRVSIGGKLIIDEGLVMHNGSKGNPIGRPQRCLFFVDRGATLIIGKNLGISAAAIVAHKSITIGNNVKIGGGVCIYDTDFHSIDPEVRNNPKLDLECKIKIPVIIKDNVFIGAHSTILKGVIIGENSIIGACSVVTKNIPSNEIWAGNPARFIKKIKDE